MIDCPEKTSRLLLCLLLPIGLLATNSASAQTGLQGSEVHSESPFLGSGSPRAPEAAVSVPSTPAPDVAVPGEVGVVVPLPQPARIETSVRTVPEAEAAKHYSVKGFAIEALTSSFASGGLGSLLLGYQGRQVTIGGNVGFEKHTVASTAFGSEDLLAVRFGPGLRVVALHSDDERTELYLHGDMGVIIVNANVPAAKDRSDGNATSAAFQLNAGVGVRYWVCPNLALGYAAMLKYTSSMNQPSDVITLEVPTSMGTPGWFLDGSFVLTAAF